MGYYVSLEIQVKTRKTIKELRAILNSSILVNVPEARIIRKGAYRYLSYKSCDFKLSPETEAKLLLLVLELAPVNKTIHGRQTPDLVFYDDLECRAWGYIISHGKILRMRTVWDYDDQTKSLSKADLLTMVYLETREG